MIRKTSNIFTMLPAAAKVRNNELILYEREVYFTFNQLKIQLLLPKQAFACLKAAMKENNF